MKPLIAALLGSVFAIGSACAQAQAQAAPGSPVAMPAHKKAAPVAKHKKVLVKKERNKKPA